MSQESDGATNAPGPAPGPAVEFTATVAGVREADGQSRGYAALVKVEPVGGGLSFEMYVPFHGHVNHRTSLPGLAFVKSLAFRTRLRVRVDVLPDSATPCSGEPTFENVQPREPPRLMWGSMDIIGAPSFGCCGVYDLTRTLVEVTVSSGTDDADRKMWVRAASVARFREFTAEERELAEERVRAARQRRGAVRLARSHLVAVVSTFYRNAGDDGNPSPVVVEVVAPDHDGGAAADADWLRALRKSLEGGSFARHPRAHHATADARAGLPQGALPPAPERGASVSGAGTTESHAALPAAALTWSEYRARAALTAGPHATSWPLRQRASYLTLGLCGEAGEAEVAGDSGTPEEFAAELGDFAFYLALSELALGMEAAHLGSDAGLCRAACALAECVKRLAIGKGLPRERTQVALDDAWGAFWRLAATCHGGPEAVLRANLAKCAGIAARRAAAGIASPR